MQAARVKVRNPATAVAADGTVRYDDADLRPMAVTLGVGSEPLVGVMNSSASCGFEWFTFVH